MPLRDWAVDPFTAAGIVSESPAPSRLIGGRYLIVSSLYHSPTGAIYLAVDVSDPQKLVLKRAYRNAPIGQNGRGAIYCLRREAEVLTRFANNPCVPSVFGLIEQDGDLFLAMEDLEGETLEQRVGVLARQGLLIPGNQLLAWGKELAAVLKTVHAKGFVYRDLKSSNIIVAPNGQLRLVDFGIAQEMEAEGRGPRYSWLHVPATVRR